MLCGERERVLPNSHGGAGCGVQSERDGEWDALTVQRSEVRGQRSGGGEGISTQRRRGRGESQRKMALIPLCVSLRPLRLCVNSGVHSVDGWAFVKCLLKFKLEKPFFTESRSEEHTSELQSLRHLVCR